MVEARIRVHELTPRPQPTCGGTTIETQTSRSLPSGLSPSASGLHRICWPRLSRKRNGRSRA